MLPGKVANQPTTTATWTMTLQTMAILLSMTMAQMVSRMRSERKAMKTN